jgi:tetratricopeptide (TPR) repeat protein
MASLLMRWMLALALIFVIAPAWASAQVPATYPEAKQAYAQKHFRAAAELFAKAADSERERPPEARTDALLMQAKCLVNLGDFAAAEPMVHAYLEQDKRSYQALYLLGYVLESENKPRESLEVFTRAAAISAPRSEDLRLVALDYVLLDDYNIAIHWLSRAVAGDSSNAEAWYDLGRAHMHLGNFAEAERDFDRVIAIEPQEARALNNLGLTYEAQNRTDEALATYSRAIDAQNNSRHPSEQPLLNQGALLNVKNRFAEAIAPLQKAVAVAPSSSRCHEELSRAYLGTHHDDLAREQMERAVFLEPKSPSLHYQLSQIYRRVGLAERAQAELKKSSDLYGTRSATMEEGERSGSTPTVHKR